MKCINPKCGAELLPGSKFCHICGRKQVKEKRRRVRANGQGCVYRLPNGKWRAEKTLGYRVEPLPEGAPPDAKPKKKRITVTDSTFETKSAALAALPYLTADRKRTGRTGAASKGTKIKLKELYDLWEPTHPRGKSTMNCYSSGFKIFAPEWYTPMDELDIDDLQACLDDAEQGRRTKENGRTALGLVYKYGIPRNCIPKDRNLAQFLLITDAGGNKHEGLNTQELELIRTAAAAGNETAIYALCQSYLGYRPSAFLQLRSADYNADERAFVGGIKTSAGIGRTVTVSPKIQSYVDALLSLHGDGYVFGNADGSRLRLPDYRAQFYALLDGLGIDNPVDENGRHRLTPHSCRHTFATLMKRTTGSDTDKLALIGHTSTTQLRDYQDVNFGDLRGITDQL